MVMNYQSPRWLEGYGRVCITPPTTTGSLEQLLITKFPFSNTESITIVLATRFRALLALWLWMVLSITENAKIITERRQAKWNGALGSGLYSVLRRETRYNVITVKHCPSIFWNIPTQQMSYCLKCPASVCSDKVSGETFPNLTFSIIQFTL